MRRVLAAAVVLVGVGVGFGLVPASPPVLAALIVVLAIGLVSPN